MGKKNWVDFKELKAQVTMKQVLSHYGLLKKLKQKGNDPTGPCPIHKGKNPTQFRVSLSKNNFNCFGDCHGGGNVLDFVGKMEGIEIRQAGQLVQEWFDLETGSETKPIQKEKPERIKEKKENEPLGFVLKQLDPQHPYLKTRRLQPETIETFGIGFCKKGIMKDRIAIPIHNEVGELVGYIGRWAGEEIPEDTPRYKLPEGFHKSLVLFNLHCALKYTGDYGLIVVEGLFGCMRIWEAGFSNVVALIGSSMSEEQEELLVANTDKITIFLDGDEAGRKGTEDILARLSKKIFTRVIELPEGSQPDNLNDEQIKNLLT